MINAILQYILYFLILVVLAIPLGNYIGKVMNSEKVFLSRILEPFENLIYKIFKVNKNEDMSWKEYLISILALSTFGFFSVFLLNLFQGILPLNPEKIKGTSIHLAFNTSASFVTNTNWQAYSGESQLSYLTQILGLTVQNFLSAGIGIAVMFALIRAFVKVQEKGIGNFWADLTKSILYILLPLSIVVSLFIASQGVVQNFSQYEEVSLLEPITLEDGSVITKQVVPQGPAASQIAIKQLGTNGGGFFGTNSAHPFENPTAFSNLIELISILLIPAALCFTFGRNVKDKRQGFAIFVAMSIMLIVALGIIAINEANATPQLSANGAIDISSIQQSGGNMEGKEARFGIPGSVTWSAFTTAASNGSVNSMLDSYTPLGGMVAMILIQLGEVVFGGVGSGLYGMISFAIVTVFIAGLMVGRTPEYLGKKIEPYEIKMAMILSLTTPLVILISSGIAAFMPEISRSLTNSGAHGFSEMLYAYSSAAGNNGSAFAGFLANTPFINITTGISMLIARFIPMTAILAIAGSLASKNKVAESAGTLPTHNLLFIGLLVFVVILVGALSLFPALALGPITEFLKMVM